MILLRAAISLLLCWQAASMGRGSFSYTARYGYLSDAQVHWQAATLAHPHLSYNSCSDDRQYRYVEVNPPQAPLKAIVVCNLHARELISSQICLSWLKQLQQQPFARSYKLQVFLIANKRRQAFIDNEPACYRKNENEVDLNRNFPTDFDHLRLPPSHQLYPGTRPIDQPFSRCLERLINSEPLDLFVDLHSGMSDTAFYQQGHNSHNELRILNHLKNRILPSLRIATLQSDNETVNGHIFADLKLRKRLKYSILFQTFYQPSPTCFLAFNPVAQQKLTVTSNYLRILNALFSSVLSIQRKQAHTDPRHDGSG